MQVHLVRRARSGSSASRSSASSCVAGHVRPQRDDGSRTTRARRPRGSAEAKTNVLPPLNRPISANGPAGRVAREPVEQRRLVDLQRRDAVVQLVRREQERRGPRSRARPSGQRSTFGKRMVAGSRSTEAWIRFLPTPVRPSTANELLQAVGHGGERYCNVRMYAQAWRSPRGRQRREHGEVRDEPDRGRGDRADDESRQSEGGDARGRRRRRREGDAADRRRRTRAERRRAARRARARSSRRARRRRRRGRTPIARAHSTSTWTTSAATASDRAASARGRGRRAAGTRP